MQPEELEPKVKLSEEDAEPKVQDPTPAESSARPPVERDPTPAESAAKGSAKARVMSKDLTPAEMAAASKKGRQASVQVKNAAVAPQTPVKGKAALDGRKAEAAREQSRLRRPLQRKARLKWP